MQQFQFLIGRLATKIEATEITVRLLFQFLIGRLATPVNCFIVKFHVTVSIPHR